MSTVEERRKKLFAAEVETSTAWLPEEFDDYIMGQVVEIKSPVTKYGRRMAIVVRADMCVMGGNSQEKGLYTIWQRAHLKQLWYRHRICVGDYIGMQYAADGEKKSGNAAKLFKITVEKTEESLPYFDPENDVPKVEGDGAPMPVGDDPPF